MVPLDLEITIARAVLGLATVDELVSATTSIRLSGYDSESLLKLTDGGLQRHRDPARPFLAAVSEIDMPIPSEIDCVLLLSRRIAWQIIRGERSTLDGAEAIRRLNLKTDDHIVALEAFRHASFEADPTSANRELRKYYDDMIMEAAMSLVRGE
jgi:hypothetical protein